MIASDSILLSMIFFSSQIICMQHKHNNKATWIKLTKQYEGNVTVDDVLQQVLQFDDTCVFFPPSVYQTFTFHTAQLVLTARLHLCFSDYSEVPISLCPSIPVTLRWQMCASLFTYLITGYAAVIVTLTQHDTCCNKNTSRSLLRDRYTSVRLDFMSHTARRAL